MNFWKICLHLLSLCAGCSTTLVREAQTVVVAPDLAQMAGKTNQSKRMWTFRASDAFGEMGLVCYVVYDGTAARITDFVMSCRAMGRMLEQFAFNHVRRELASEGLSLAGIDFTPTAKNGPFRAFLETLDLSGEQKTHFRNY